MMDRSLGLQNERVVHGSHDHRSTPLLCGLIPPQAVFFFLLIGMHRDMPEMQWRAFLVTVLHLCFHRSVVLTIINCSTSLLFIHYHRHGQRSCCEVEMPLVTDTDLLPISLPSLLSLSATIFSPFDHPAPS